MTEFVNLDAAYDADTLEDWYISSVGPEPPVWTNEHIEELLNDFYVIPKDTPAADVVPIVRCKDCTYCEETHYEDDGEPPYIKTYCSLLNRTIQPNDFCSYGERKEFDNG